MVLNGVALDTLSYGQLVMSVGLTVDYIIHISAAISDAKVQSDNYEQRLNVAFHEMGIGVAKGALTTLLGTMALIFSESLAFRNFFFMVTGIIIVSVLHGFLLIPAILAECPFIYKKYQIKPSTN